MPMNMIYKDRNQEVDKISVGEDVCRWKLTVYQGAYTRKAAWKCNMAALTASQHVESYHPAMPPPALLIRGIALGCVKGMLAM